MEKQTKTIEREEFERQVKPIQEHGKQLIKTNDRDSASLEKLKKAFNKFLKERISKFSDIKGKINPNETDL